MAPTASARMCSYELPLQGTDFTPSNAGKPIACASLPAPFLIENALWFCRLRWIVIAILTAFGTLGLVPGLFQRVGLQPNANWPFVAAGILLLANVGFLTHARLLSRSPTLSGAMISLWSQIVLDLLILTVVVNFVGSLGTFVSFAYLFHIVLACIFFSWPQSLAVTFIAGAMYVGCVLAVSLGIVPFDSIYADAALRETIKGTPGIAFLNVVSALAIWLVVWYLTSHLSAMVREREHRLAETNRQLEAAQEERAKHVLHTTHELKAPFAAIEANTQLLLKGYCGDLPEQVRDTVSRIAARSHRLASEIQEMLQLANLRSTSDNANQRVNLDLSETLAWCMAQAQPMAQQHEVVIEGDLEPARTLAVEDHMKMLFANLLANALLYSQRGGRVCARCTCSSGTPTVTIEDEGIGIPAEKLPRIFDEYYRTNEAVRHNKESSGLGLAIVRHVVQTNEIGVRVESKPGVGTRFVLRFAPVVGAPDAGKEMEDDVCDGS